MTPKFKTAQRLEKLPPYLFIEIDKMKNAAKQKGVDIISLGIGDPDRPTPQPIIDRMKIAVQDPSTHQYPLGWGLMSFRETMAKYYKNKFNVSLDPKTEVLTLIGSKEGVGHLPLAFVEQGDVVLVPDPGYPVYKSGTIFAGGDPYLMPLLAENNFLPDFDAIPESVYKKTKLMYLNYPNNPTAALAPADLFKKAIALAEKYGFIICHDAAYIDTVYDGEKAISFLEMPGAKEVGIELHSLSKTFNMTGWRLASAVGNADVLNGLGSIKENLDSGAFHAIQLAGIEAFEMDEKITKAIVDVYQARRDALVSGLRSIGWDVPMPKATFYCWMKTINNMSSMEMTKLLLEKCGIVTTPGVGFGPNGEGFIRMALTVDVDRIKEAIDRIKKL